MGGYGLVRVNIELLPHVHSLFDTQIIDDAPRMGGKKSGIGDISKPLNSEYGKVTPG